MGWILGSRALGAVLGAFAAVTAAWIAWALATPGDYFGNGSALVIPSFGGAVVLGSAFGFFARARFRKVLVVAGALGLCYWAFAPSDWWVHPPPRPRATSSPAR